jgi:hypothetical protein
MSVDPFPRGDTFVAFMDIMGFKAMMQDGDRAPRALDAFYSAGFNVLRYLREHPADGPLVDGFFVSDCGVLFVRGENELPHIRLESLCRVIRKIHQQSFNLAVQLKTSIAWGEFSYSERIEFPGIGKSAFSGNAYVDAFTDNEHGEPKLYHSDCRLVRKGLPPDVVSQCTQKIGPVFSRMRKAKTYFYYEWMTDLYQAEMF